MAIITSANLANAIVKLVAVDALPALMGNLVMGNLVARDFEPTLANAGDTVNVPVPPIMTAYNLAEGGSVTPQNPDVATSQIVLNTHAEATFTIPDVTKVPAQHLDAAHIDEAKGVEPGARGGAGDALALAVVEVAAVMAEVVDEVVARRRHRAGEPGLDSVRILVAAFLGAGRARGERAERDEDRVAKLLVHEVSSLCFSVNAMRCDAMRCDAGRGLGLRPRSRGRLRTGSGAGSSAG